MDKKRILTPAVVTSVALIHVGLVALVWHAHKPPPVEMANIEFVDLGDFGGGDGSPEGEGAPAEIAQIDKFNIRHFDRRRFVRVP